MRYFLKPNTNLIPFLKNNFISRGKLVILLYDRYVNYIKELPYALDLREE